MSLNRRTFAKHLAAGAIAGAPATAIAAADDPDSPAAQEKPPAPAKLVLNLVKQLYPKNLDEAKLEQIRGQIEHHLSRSKALAAFPLTNTDEPAPVFAAWRNEG